MNFSDLFVALGAPAGLIASVPILYSGAMIVEREMRPEARVDLSNLLSGSTYPSSNTKIFPITISLFKATFSEAQFGGKCVRSSLCLTLTIVIGMVIVSLINYHIMPLYFLGIILIILFGGLIGFLAIFKTRILLKLSMLIEIPILIVLLVDFLLAWILSCAAFEIWIILDHLSNSIIFGQDFSLSYEFNDIQNLFIFFFFSANFFQYLLTFLFGNPISPDFLTALICSCTAFVGTIWLVMSVMALLAIKLLSPVRKWISWGLAVDQHPLRAVALAGITIMVSGSIVLNLAFHMFN